MPLARIAEVLDPTGLREGMNRQRYTKGLTQEDT
jgi:hypothetical protein